MRRRVFAFLMTLVLLVSMVPTSVFAEGNVGSGTAEAPYQIGDTVTNDGSAEPAGVTTENTYWARKDVYDLSVLVCTKEVHDHATAPCAQITAAVECTKEGHPVDGTLTCTHEDGTACNYDPQQAKWFTIGTAWNCGKEAHAHVDSCYKYVNTVWTLADAAVSEKTCLEGCILTGEEHDECLVWVACTKTEGCEGPEGHEGECYTSGDFADTTYEVTLEARQDGSRLRMVEIMIVDAEGNTVDYVTTNNWGNATIDLPDGTYTAIVSYTSGNYAYEGEATFIVNGGEKTVTINVVREVSTSYGESIYNRTTYFNHVDIRVKGTYTTGSTDDLTTYNIKLQNVTVAVNNPDGSGYDDEKQSFSNNSESYEWRLMGIQVHKDAVITLTCDIINSVTGEVMKSGFTTSFSGKDDFIQAIINCDANQGLDFIIDPVEIIAAVAHEVSYQWNVVDANGNVIEGASIPANVAVLPGTTGGYKDGSSHTIDTIYQEGDYVIVESADGTTATAYQFFGWDWWSHEDDNDLDKNPIGSSQTDVTVTDDTIVYGVWKTFELEKATSHLTITKQFAGNGDSLPANYTIVVTGPLGGDYDIPLSLFTESNGVYTYNMPVYTEGTFTIKEEAYEIDGYNFSGATVVVTDAPAEGHEHLTEVSGSNKGTEVQIQVELHWQEAGTESVSTADDTQHDILGSVAFTNTYAQNHGGDLYNLPNLRIDKLDAADRSVLEGATFELRDASGDVVVNGDGVALRGTSDESGYITFNNIPVDEDAEDRKTTYYLVETDAPEGYHVGFAKYKVVITEKEGSPTDILYEGIWYDYHQYDMEVMVDLGNGEGYVPSQHFSVGTTGNRFRLAAFNFKIDGQLTITKDFAGIDEDALPDSVTVNVIGPNDYSEDVTLTAANSWTTTLTGLELGTYYVNETAMVVGGSEVAIENASYAVPGYFLDSTTYAVVDGIPAAGAVRNNAVTLSDTDVETIEDGDYVAAAAVKVTNTFIRREDADYIFPVLEVKKVRDTNQQPIAGVTFTLYYGDTAVATETTGANGLAIFNFAAHADRLEQLVTALNDPENITFTLKETQAAPGYAANETEYTVTLHKVSEDENLEEGIFVTDHTYFVKVGNGTGASTYVHTVKNTKDEGSLTIQKTFGANNAYVPASITVAVAGPDGYTNTVTLSAQNNWTVTLENIALGTYTVTEQSMVTHGGETVMLDGSVKSFKDGDHTYYFYVEDSVTVATVELSSAVENGTASLTNIYTREVINPAAFQVKKIGEDGKLLSGATFALYDEDGNAVMSEITGSDGVATFVGFTEAATYYLKETIAPAGYYLDDTIWEVTVKLKDGDPTIEINAQTGVWESIFNWIASLVGKDNGHYADGVLTVMNAQNPGLNIVKQDIATNAVVPGAGFTLYSDSTLQTAVGTERIVGENGTLNLPITAPGTYYLKETTTPSGYLANTTVYEVVAAEVETTIGNYKVTTLEVEIDSLDTETVEGVDHYVIYNEKLVTVDVKKVWDDHDYHARPDSVTAALLCDGDEVATVTLNASNGWSHTWASYEDEDGKTVYLTNAHTWTVEEKNDFSDLGYEDPQYRGEADEWTIVNKRNINLIDVTVTKEWDTNGDHHEAPESVTVQLMGNNAAYGNEVVLNEANDWTHTWEDLSDAYEWTVAEDDVEGYEIQDIEVDKANNGDLEFTITNERIINDVTITVTKEWVNGEKDKKVTFPTSVKVALYKDGVKVETVTLNAGNNWTYTWDDLTDEHEWKVDEPSVPSGYIKTISVISKETTNGFEYTYEITNTYNSNPKTGDGFGMGFWMMGMTVPVLALFVLYIMAGTRKKGKYEA